MSTMNISLPEALKQFVEQQAARAGYSSVSDYVRDLIRQERAREAERRLAELIQNGLESGAAVPIDSRYWAVKSARIRAPAPGRRRRT
jgi:antitoxin ParD1/3/4